MVKFVKSVQTIQERMSMFQNNPDFPLDMVFVVGPEKLKIGAHKFVLMTCSWEFYNVFNLLKLDSDELLVDDVSSSSFPGFLTYCYTGKVVFNAENAVDILNLAYRFKMKHLIVIAEQYLSTTLNNDNMFQLFQASLCLPDHSKLQQTILRKIGEDFTTLLQTNLQGFVNLPYSALHLIATCDLLTCTESELFHAMIKWATKSCAKNGVPPTPINLRAILRDAFFKIRFPVMPSNDFMECLAKYPGMFTVNETADICSVIRKDRECCQVFNSQKFWRITDGVPSVSDDKLILPGVSDTEFVSCYVYKMQKITNIVTRNTEIKFVMNSTMSFEGFAFFVKRNDTFKVKSCSLSVLDCEQDNTWLNKDATVIVQARHQVEWSKLDIVILKVNFDNLPYRPFGWWYELKCSFNVFVSTLHLDLYSRNNFDMTVPTVLKNNFIQLAYCTNASFLIVKHLK